MPELPDILAYLHALKPRVVGQPLHHIRIISPFVLRTFDPPIEDAVNRTITHLGRIGKRIVFSLSGPDELQLVVHLMIAGRFRWAGSPARPPARITLAAFEFPHGSLLLTEASPRKRAGMYLVRGAAASAALDPGGLDVLSADLSSFTAALTRERHTLKRALTDPRLIDGIGNAYSDEILHAARLSPIKRTDQLSADECVRLFEATRATLRHWIDVLQKRFDERFPGPGEITAFRPEFAVHGRFGKPCPACGTAVQRIRYAENETNYCPRCQTGGRLLADRSLSRLLKEDWPRSMDEWEAGSTDRRG